jgi:hypothetical protein
LVSVLLLGRAFYNIYVRRNATRLTAVVAWLALAFMVVFWTWQLCVGQIHWGVGSGS